MVINEHAIKIATLKHNLSLNQLSNPFFLPTCPPEHCNQWYPIRIIYNFCTWESIDHFMRIRSVMILQLGKICDASDTR